MGQLDLSFNDAVKALQDLPSDAVGIVVADANISRDSTIWPRPSRVDEETFLSAVNALERAATTPAQRDAIKVVAGAARDSHPMNNDMNRRYA
ncbi:MAG TPA: hypothetical protein VIF12_00195 [Micavibrio sp.]